jgi:glycosyltransferase involved in cell wall biosynthesis
LRVAFVYPNPRFSLIEALAKGEAPDTSLLGQNHLAALGIESYVYDSIIRRRIPLRGPLHRLTWHARELVLPWELRDTDVLCTPLATLLPLAARLRRRPRVLTISYHLVATYTRAGPARRRLMRHVLASAGHIVCSSEEGRRRLLVQTGIDERRVSTALLGVDPRYWQPTPPAPDGYVLSVGRDLARDYRTLFRAVGSLPVRVIVVAKQENLAGLEVPPNVDVRLNIAAAEVRELYAGAGCVVVPVVSEANAVGTENSGTIAYLEAAATARPAVVTRRSFLDDYLDPPRTALTVPAEDPAAMRDAVEAVLGDGVKAAAMGAAARASVEERFTTRHLAERLAHVIRKSLG